MRHCMIFKFQLLLANFLAQTEALMKGKTKDEAKAELVRSNTPEDHINRILPHKVSKIRIILCLRYIIN